jgi:hypothetical protein
LGTEISDQISDKMSKVSWIAFSWCSLIFSLDHPALGESATEMQSMLMQSINITITTTFGEKYHRIWRKSMKVDENGHKWKNTITDGGSTATHSPAISGLDGSFSES